MSQTRKLRNSLFLGFVMAVLASGGAHAVSTSFWLTDSGPDFEAGRVQGTSVREDGTVVLGPSLSILAAPEVGHIWQAASGADGDVYFVAGAPGRLYRLERDEPELLLESEDDDFPAVVVGRKRSVFVGTSPGGQVLTVDPDGNSRVFFETGECCVWCLAYSQKFGLLVGTGDPAKVFQVDSNGNGKPIYDSEELSISSLVATDDVVLAGTSGEGLLLDVTPGHEVRVIFDSRHEEVTGIVPDAQGGIYFATTTVSMEQSLEPMDDPGNSLGEGCVYRMSPDGAVVELRQFPDHPVMCLGPGRADEVLAGMGSHGLIYSVGPDGDRTLFADLEDEQVLSLTESKDGLLVTTAGRASIYRMGLKPGNSGVYESDVLDAGVMARWGEMRWASDEPGGAQVAISFRSGNTAEPDDTWNRWSEVDGDSEGRVSAPRSRFLQWKAELERSGDDVPALRSVEVAYVEDNLAPKMVAVVVLSQGDGMGEGAGELGDEALRQKLPGGIEVTYSQDAAFGSESNDLKAVVASLRTVAWEAFDPNGDRLRYDLFVRAERERHWTHVESDVERNVHTIDTQSMPDGWYLAKVIAYDRPDNPGDLALADELASDPFVVDNTPPAIGDVDVERRSGGLIVTGESRDRLSPLARVDWALDYGPWQSAFASDGIFDSLAEDFSFEVDDVEKGAHTLAVRVIDRAGNLASKRLAVE